MQPFSNAFWLNSGVIFNRFWCQKSLEIDTANETATISFQKLSFFDFERLLDLLGASLGGFGLELGAHWGSQNTRPASRAVTRRDPKGRPIVPGKRPHPTPAQTSTVRHNNRPKASASHSKPDGQSTQRPPQVARTKPSQSSDVKPRKSGSYSSDPGTPPKKGKSKKKMRPGKNARRREAMNKKK